MPSREAEVPVWTLASEDALDKGLIEASAMTPERLESLRSALAEFLDQPLATLERHPGRGRADERRHVGVALSASSPLAGELARLVSHTSRVGQPVKESLEVSGDVLYRMVLPAKVAEQVGAGLLKPMAAKGIEGGIRGSLVNSTGVATQAAFVPVVSRGAAAASGAAGVTTSAAGVGGAAVATGALTVAAPLVLAAVAAGMTARAEAERSQALDSLNSSLMALRNETWESQRDKLDASREIIDKATALLLDRARIRASIGLDSAAHDVGSAMSAVRRRLGAWEKSLTDLADHDVTVSELNSGFPGILDSDGEFRVHLETASLAIALQRRLLVLQAVEHAQGEGVDNVLRAFLNEVNRENEALSDLENRVGKLLTGLSSLTLKRPGGLLNAVFTAAEVDKLLDAAYRLQAWKPEMNTSRRSDVVIEIDQSADGSLTVYPAYALDE